MLEPADDSLLQSLAEGREEAFAALYDRFAASLFQAALSILGSRHDAEDAVQDIFVGLVRARERLFQVENLRAYLFAALRRAAARIAVSSQRRKLLSQQELIHLSADEPKRVDLDRAVDLERALRGLPAEQREIIALKVDGGLTFAEIAAVLDINANTAASRYRYALEKLRAALEA